MTVRENLELGAFMARRLGKRHISERITQVLEIFPVLSAQAHRKAGELSGGQQQMVAMGQALMTGARLMLLDEPCGGLAPAAIQMMYERIGVLRDLGIGILIVEQNISSALAVSSRCYVMEAGWIVYSGSTKSLQGERQVADIIRGAIRGWSGGPAGRESQDRDVAKWRRQKRGASKWRRGNLFPLTE